MLGKKNGKNEGWPKKKERSRNRKKNKSCNSNSKILIADVADFKMANVIIKGNLVKLLNLQFYVILNFFIIGY